MKRIIAVGIFIIQGSIIQGQTNAYRLDLNTVHEIDKKLVTFAGVGFVGSPEANYNQYYFSFPGVMYTPEKWIQFWGGFKDFFTNNWETDNTNELRPYAGMKLLVLNSAKVHLFNFTQYEYRYITNTTTKSIQKYGRIRNRLGIETPLSSDAWSAKTFYFMADAEPFYRFDKDMVDQIRLRMGPGYVVNEKIRLELMWRMQLSRSTKSDPFEWTENTFRLNVKISSKNGLFKRLIHPDFEID